MPIVEEGKVESVFDVKQTEKPRRLVFDLWIDDSMSPNSHPDDIISEAGTEPEDFDEVKLVCGNIYAAWRTGQPVCLYIGHFE